MVKTKDAVSNWVNLMVDGNTPTDKNPCRASSCSAHGYYFLSYDTPIAKFCGDHFKVSTRKYSSSTSTVQNLLRNEAEKRNMLVEVDEIKDNGEFPWRR